MVIMSEFGQLLGKFEDARAVVGASGGDIQRGTPEYDVVADAHSAGLEAGLSGHQMLLVMTSGNAEISLVRSEDGIELNLTQPSQQ